MDESTPFYRKHLLKTVGVLFFASMLASCTELRYLAWGRVTQGHVTEVTRSGLSQPGETAWRVKYDFQDNGQPRREETRVVEGQRAVPAAGEPVPIQYVPGSSGTSRLAGQRDTVALAIFFGSLALMIGASIYLAWRDREPRPRRH
jgi:hypothetical protein